jgi:hypothetical protein
MRLIAKKQNGQSQAQTKKTVLFKSFIHTGLDNVKKTRDEYLMLEHP